jgi:flagellar hook-associated protein 2
MYSSGSIGGSSSTSYASWVENLVQQTVALERAQRITPLETQRDELKVRKAVYSDMDTKLTALRTALENIIGSDTEDDVFSNMAVSSSDSGVATASAGTNPSVGQYGVTINQLAQNHKMSSYR